MKKKIILLAIFLSLLAIAYWFSNHSIIAIEVENPPSGEFTYKFLKQPGKDAKAVKSTSNHIRKIVSKGAYEVLITNGDKNNFSIVKTKGFLGTISIKAGLDQESSRLYVGDQPSGSIKLINNILVSYRPTDLYSNIQIHVPANADQPTYKVKNPLKGVTGYVEGIFNAGESTLALVRTIPQSEGLKDSGQFAYFINESLAPSSSVLLGDLDKNQNYSVNPYGSGFIVYSQSFDDIKNYSSTKSAPTTLKTGISDTKELVPLSLDVKDDNLLAIYGKNPNPEEEISPAKMIKEVIINIGGETRNFEFRMDYYNGLFCGNNRICLLGNDKLDVYDLAGKKPRLLFSLVGVAAIERQSDKLLVIKPEGALLIDIEARSGYLDYSFGAYKFSGLNIERDNYLLSLINQKGKKVALLINRSLKNTDEVDKKIQNLEELTEISDISINGKYIYISPELGELIYDKETDGYVYDPVVKQRVNQKINSEVDKLGIDRQHYVIVNTSD